MRRPGQVLSRYQLLEHAWDIAYENKSNVVDVYVRYLREKVDRPFGVESLETVRGAGYRLRGRRVSRWPLRLRLALVFAAASAVVLAAVGAVLYFSVKEVLDEQIAEPPANRPTRSATATRCSHRCSR